MRQVEKRATRDQSALAVLHSSLYLYWLAGPIIRFMQQHLALLSPDSKPVKILCAPCDDKQAGGFHPELGILVCANHLFNKTHMEDTLAHEMVHEFDNRRFEVDWSNLKHHACSEVGKHVAFGFTLMLRVGADRSEQRT